MRFRRLFVTAIVLLHFVPFTFAQDAPILQHIGPIRSVEFSPVDNSLVVSASDDHTIKLWNLQDNTVTIFRGHTAKVNAVAFSPNGQFLASGSNDLTFKLWDVQKQLIIATLEHIPIIGGSPSEVLAVAFSPDGQSLATAGYQSVKLWNVDDQTEMATFQHEDWVSAIVFSPNGQLLAAVDGKQMKIWDLQKQQIIAQLEGDADWIGAIAFSPDSQTFVGAGAAGQITLWNVSDWKVIGRINAGYSVSDFAFSPDGKILASAGQEVGLWSVENGGKIAAFTKHTGWVMEVAFSPDGTTIASGGGDDGRLYVQNIKHHLESQHQRDMVRLIYFLPSDRSSQPDINTKIETWVKATQTFFADTMEEHGYGRKTFAYETDANGKAVVHHITGQFTDAHYNNNDKWRVWDEIEDAGLNPTKHIYMAFMDFSEILDGLHCGTGGNWDRGGVVNLIASSECLDGDYGRWLAAHEFGHALGLQHDYRNHPDSALGLGGDEDLMISSACTAKWLDAHRYFNRDTTYFNEPTTIEMWPPRAVSSEGIRLRFTITDPDGLHQAQLLSTYLYEDYFAGRDYLEEKNYLDQDNTFAKKS